MAIYMTLNVITPRLCVCICHRKGSVATLNSPHISLNLQKLSFVPKFKYLGSFITQDNSDDENMRRQRSNCYARSNGIIKHFYACSPVVKCDLFKAFCCNMYCSHFNGLILKMIL